MFKFNMNLIGNINKIVAYPDAMIEVKYRIGNRYRIATKAVEGSQYSCESQYTTAVQTPASGAYSYIQTWQYSPARV